MSREATAVKMIGVSARGYVDTTVAGISMVSEVSTSKKCRSGVDNNKGHEGGLDESDDESEGDEEDEVSLHRDPPANCVRLRPSQFKGLPATVFFEYPLELKILRDDESYIEPLGDRKLQYKCYWKRVCIKNAFRRAGFDLVEKSSKWTALWSKHQNSSQLQQLGCLQKTNHFLASWCVGRKDRLMRTLNAMKRIHGHHYNFHPDGFILPVEREAFLRQVQSDLNLFRCRTLGPISKQKLDRASLWINKPVASSCGKGIKVLTSSQALAIGRNKKALLQRYLHSPYLIDDKKFDLRIYVVVTGVDPLRVYVHQEGLTRISTSAYSLNNTKNRFAHLTNYTINKKSDKFVAASVEEEEASGSNDKESFKWSLHSFKRWLSEREGEERAEKCFEDVYDLVLKTMIAAESEITPKLHTDASYRSSCYELFGCDVILDRSLTPFLLEVNVSPSLMGSSPLDRKVKGTLISDMFHLVGFYPHDTSLAKQYEATGTFSFSSLSKLVPDSWRRDPSPHNIEWTGIGNASTIWTPLLMVDDELTR